MKRSLLSVVQPTVTSDGRDVGGSTHIDSMILCQWQGRPPVDLML